MRNADIPSNFSVDLDFSYCQWVCLYLSDSFFNFRLCHLYYGGECSSV